jgi:hypothetical protein
MVNGSWEGDFTDTSFTRISSNLVKTLFSIIPDGTGNYLTI